MVIETLLYLLIPGILSLTAIFSILKTFAYLSKNGKNDVVIDFIVSKKIRVLGSIFLWHYWIAVNLIC